MRPLVLGGNGFVGSTVVRALAARDVDVVSLSRSGVAFAGEALRGDVTRPDLGLGAADAAELRASVTHVVSCFGSVDWGAGPRLATELHRDGTRNALAFAASCERLERFVHLSSVLALGRAEGTLTDELELGQAFRNFYEYGKFLAEREVRANETLPWRVVRVGGVLGPGIDVPPDTRHGLLSAVPFLLQGYPVHLAEHGRFPCYVGDAATCGEVLARAALDDGAGDVWTWFDDARPALIDVLTAVCGAWDVVPRVVTSPLLGRVTRAGASRLGLPRELLDYTEPWMDIAPEALRADLPRCPDGYLAATGAALRDAGLRWGVAA